MFLSIYRARSSLMMESWFYVVLQKSKSYTIKAGVAVLFFFNSSTGRDFVCLMFDVFFFF